MRGFSRAVISQIVRMTNELKGTDIKPIKFVKRKTLKRQYERLDKMTKEELIELKRKIEKYVSKNQKVN